MLPGTVRSALRLLLLLTLVSFCPISEVAGKPSAKNTGPAKSPSEISFEYRDSPADHSLLMIRSKALIKDHHVFQLDNPTRLVLDIPGVVIRGRSTEIPVRGQALSRIRIVQHSGKVRFVFDLVEEKNINHRIFASDKGRCLNVVISSDRDQPAPAAEPQQVAQETFNDSRKNSDLTDPFASDADRQNRTLSRSEIDTLFETHWVNVFFHKIPVKEFFRYVSEISGYKIEVHPEITEVVSLRFKDVPLGTVVNAAADRIGFAIKNVGEYFLIVRRTSSPTGKTDALNLFG